MEQTDITKTEATQSNNNKEGWWKGWIGIIVLFVACALFTYYVEEYEDTDTTDTTEVISDMNKNPNADAAPVATEPTDPYKELSELIGLDSVKSQVNTMANFIRICNERRKSGLKTPNISYHCVFTGNPGTGKTTVARIMAGIYKDLGVVTKGHLVETDRSGLIAEYVGQTAVKTNAIIDSALGGVLFIDEAYALVQGGEDYGNEAIATLLKRMEDNRDNLVVIVAGYPDEMHKFINANPGLKSRFNNYIDFQDYNADELTRIFETYVRKYNYTLTSEARDFVYKNMKTQIARHDRNFGNARYARNLFEKSIQVQANRLAADKDRKTEDLSVITVDDIKKAKVEGVK